MSARLLLRIWIALAVVPLVAGAAFASQSSVFVCPGDGLVHRDCCCPGDGHRVGAPASSQAELEAACCCDVSQMSVPAPSPATEPRVSGAVAPLKVFLGPVSLVVVEPSLAAKRWRLVSRAAHAPPPAIPILRQKQSLLI
jgi:hypothetical protein